MPGSVLSAQAGFWGKLPARGDFVGRGLPEPFRRRWDRWAAAHLARREDWPEGGLRLRIASGGRAAAGLVLPSADAVGRRFPLALFLLADSLPGPEALEPWCEAALQAAAEPDPDALWQALAALPAPAGKAEAPPLLLWQRGHPALAADPEAPGPALAALFSSG
ncbi:type VI secretion system-associated protein TagF [Paracoccus sp. P2]|uniref:Type VI secretion system protein ImpM n=1 Tax=Paracoccus pantotrophus TaxID=82367 RepID=A0A1I5HKR1_PARPN|nr:type VI secretion system-associated protein TagF [Paracoccus pantotrophus]MDF3854716.1 type VI secretion system-associated protein TagF [Paracoccus pantotrophus]QFG38225.1 type VI secretion system-associated protein TagF [Paracoccus pantotrophus]QLH15762.1 type VI secretion system-associated protein TagF [Paracoccus pantotrophus]RDD94520.1 type VI secretion system-associated protein TagF [Paracoccus pantotrophus]RKS51264.1 type VI secretion system protein ImpM [Paracoccus pantotrophus]